MHNIQYEDCRNVAHHEIIYAYEETHVIWSNIKKSLGHKYGEVTSNLVPHIAELFTAPVGGKRMGSAGIYSINLYIYMFVPEDGIDEATAAYDARYSGISKDS